jgi:hypothetical protein
MPPVRRRPFSARFIQRCPTADTGMTILSCAVNDRKILTNPGRINRASTEHVSERPVATVAEVEALADAVVAQYRAMALLAARCSLRFGEQAALTRW